MTSMRNLIFVAMLALGFGAYAQAPASVAAVSNPVKLTLTSTSAPGGNRDVALFGIADDATLGFDANYDATKIIGGSLDLWLTPVPGLDLTVSYVPGPLAGTACPIGVRTAYSGNHTITFTGDTNLRAWNIKLQVYDSTTQQTTPLSVQSAFTWNLANPGIDRRYVLNYVPATGLASALATAVSASVFPNPSSTPSWQVKGEVLLASTMTLYNATGAVAGMVHVSRPSSDTYMLEAHQVLAPGVYYVLATSPSGAVGSLKLVLR